MWANTVTSLAQLKAFPTISRIPPLATGTPIPLVSSFGISANWLFFSAESTATPDDVTVFQPDDVPAGEAGRWLLGGVGSFGPILTPNIWNGNQAPQSVPLGIDPLNATLEIDSAAGNYFLLNPLQNFNIATPLNSRSGIWFILSVQQPAAPVLVDFVGSFRFAGKVKPQLSAEPGAIDEILFRCRSGGSSPIWLVSPALNFGVA